MKKKYLIENNLLSKILCKTLVVNSLISILLLSLFIFIIYISITGIGHFELRSSLWLFILFPVGSYFIYGTITIIIDFIMNDIVYLDCREATLTIDGKKMSYLVDYIDINGIKHNIVLRGADGHKPFRLLLRKTPIRLYHTKRSKIIIGFEEKGKVTWFASKRTKVDGGLSRCIK